MNILQIILGILEEGFLYAIVSLGVYITYKILDFPDLTVDGSFPLGAALCAVLIKNGVNPIIVLPISFTCGLIIGFITGFIHIKLKVRDLLSGIIVMTALYSVNLRIAGKSNLPIFKQTSIFKNNFLVGGQGITSSLLNEEILKFYPVIVLLIIVLICKILLDLYFNTKSGYLLKAVGDNPSIVTLLARNSGDIKIFGLCIANGFVVLAGAIYCQHKGFFEISTGTGTVVIALANVIIGLKCIEIFKFLKPTTAVIIGSIIYRTCVSITLQLGVPSSDLKIITSLLLLIVLIINKKEKKKLV